jgi:hypothetical protein
LIYHAEAAMPFPVLPHPVSMILLHFRILLIPPIRFLTLLAPAHTPALFTAVDLSAITRPANEEHRPALVQPAEQLPMRDFSRH